MGERLLKKGALESPSLRCGKTEAQEQNGWGTLSKSELEVAVWLLSICIAGKPQWSLGPKSRSLSAQGSFSGCSSNHYSPSQQGDTGTLMAIESELPADHLLVRPPSGPSTALMEQVGVFLDTSTRREERKEKDLHTTATWR